VNLEELKAEALNCQACPLSRLGRRQVVFGVGNEKADLMFVGEAPGYWEDVEGEPFVGPAGKLLTKMINSIGLERSEVYITNVVKCRPPENRDPEPEEVSVCVPRYLKKQIEIIKPRVIVTLGNHATKTLLGRASGITLLRGKKFQASNYFIFPTYHPAAILRNANLLKVFAEDFQTLKEILKEEPPKEPAQLTLF